MPAFGPGCDERAPWLRLALTPGVGPTAAKRLIEALGSPEAVFRADHARLSALTSPRLSSALLADDAERETALAAALAWTERPDCHLLCLGRPGYPPRLAELADPPPVLFVHGDPRWLLRPTIAIVGSRNATVDGVATAAAFGEALAAAGLTVVSGMALGIDAAAHRGALHHPAGTIGVLGHGIDVVYPRAHAGLAAQVRAGGALVAERPLGEPPSKWSFPQRNRVIAGLSAGVLVVEAARRSGALITARCALDASREVFAIPGSIHAPLSKGCHALIRQGATLVETADDVLAELRHLVPPASAHACGSTGSTDSTGSTGAGSAPVAAGDTHAEAADGAVHDDPQRALLAALGWHPVGAEALLARVGGPVGRLSGALAQLEIAGRIERLSDGRFRRLPDPR